MCVAIRVAVVWFFSLYGVIAVVGVIVCVARQYADVGSLEEIRMARIEHSRIAACALATASYAT